MRGQRGYSVIELLVASAVLLAVCGSVFGLLHDALAATPVLEETTDIHQRSRVAADALAADVRAAAAGTAAGALSPYLAAVEPREPWAPPGSAGDTVLTLRYTMPGGAHARLAQTLDPGALVVMLDGAGCPSGTAACGFTAGAQAVIVDDAGFAAFVAVDSIGPGTLVVSDPYAGRAVAFPAGALVAEATEVSYAYDPGARQLRRTEGGGSFVIADNVVGASFDYFGDGALPLPLGVFQDGPFQGSGPLAFDTDLARVGAVRATLRFETGADSMRGTDPQLFSRPGTASRRMVIPDVRWSVLVALRNRE
jgi:hypothetical protein